jgi:hypothetical protein
VLRLTNGNSVPVIYDWIGKSTFGGSGQCDEMSLDQRVQSDCPVLPGSYADHRLTTETPRTNSIKGGQTLPNTIVFVDIFDDYLRWGRRGAPWRDAWVKSQPDLNVSIDRCASLT